MNKKETNEIMENITEDRSLCIIREALTQYKGDKVEIEAEDGDDFVEYCYTDGTRVKEGTAVGYEYEYPSEHDQIELNDGIFYA